MCVCVYLLMLLVVSATCVCVWDSVVHREVMVLSGFVECACE